MGKLYFKKLIRSLFFALIITHIAFNSDAQTYCSAGANNCDEYISKVELNTISKTSGCGLGNNNSPGYSDYTAISTILEQGKSYTLTVTNNNHYNGDYYDVYLDWNHDYDFADQGEYIGTLNTSPAQFTINVPQGLTFTGKTVLRIRCRYYGSQNPCGFSSWGEVEDYSVILTIPYRNDAGVSAVDSPAVPVRPGWANVKVRIKNYGQDTLKSAGIDWKADTTSKTSYSWTGSLATGSTSSQINLGNHYFSIGQHVIKAWTKNPNNVTDSNITNDTFTYNFYACNAMNGTYTIGKDANDSFPSFSAAVYRLINCGVSGPVTFVVDTGTYQEQIKITQIPGASSTNTITFKSAVSDSSKVTLAYGATDANLNYVVMLDGADYIRFEKITIQATGNNYARVLMLVNGADNNIFKNNKFIGYQAYSTHDKFALVFSDESRDTANLFENNYFFNGSYGIFFLGNFDFGENYNRFNSNYFKNQYYSAIHIEAQKGHEINYNLIETNSSNFYTGIYLYSCSGGFVNIGNKIILEESTGGGIGIYLISCNSLPGSRGLTANNFISFPCPNSSNTYGIYHSYSTYQDIVYNSIHIYGNYKYTYGFYYSGSFAANCLFQNNISANQATGYAIYCNNNSGITSDFNDLYSNGQFLGYWNAQITNLSTWISASKQDSHSISVLPQFSSNSDLHLSDINLNGKAKPFAAVNIDIDKESRSTTAPDIGADEFDLKSRDIGVIIIEQPITPTYPGVTPVKIRFRNFGTDTIKTAYIDWKYDGNARTTKTWTGSLKSGDTSATITLDSVNVTLGMHTLKIWTKNPNNQSDQNPVNDTMVVTFQSCIPLNGTYTIGPNPGDSFSSITAAINALVNRCGVSGPVVFKIASGTYNEQVVIPEIMGASSTNTITFESAAGDSSKVIITSGANSYSFNYTVLLNGADYIRFKNLTISTTSNYYARVLVLQNGASHNQFLNCRFIGYSSTLTSNYQAVVYLYDYSDFQSDDNLWLNNLLVNGSFGFYFISQYQSKGFNNRIISNTIQNPYYMGIYSFNQNSPVYEKNIISTNSTYSDFYGFYLYTNVDEIRVLSNKISAPGTGGGMGIYFNNCQSSIDKKALTANNFIYLNNSVNPLYGIYISNCFYHQVYYNSINLTGSYSSGAGIYYSGIQSNTGNMLLNNCIYNQTGAVAIEFSGNRPDSSDCNNYYSTGSVLGTDLGSGKSSLANWQSSTGKDIHSVSVVPDYLSNSDLHTVNIMLNGKAVPAANVPKDIDDENRHSVTPDIGADEFTPPANDAGVYAITSPSTTGSNKSGQYAVKITLKNFGLDTLKTVSIEWKINNTAQTTYNWSGTLPPNQTIANISLGNYNFGMGTYTIKAWTKNPNNSADLNKTNDTQLVTVKFTNICDTMTIGGSGASFPNFTSAIDTMNAYGICGPVVFLVNSGTYNEQISLTKIDGSSPTNTITFISASNDSTSVVLTYSPSSSNLYVINMNGACFYRFYKMTFKNTSANYGRVLNVQNNSYNNRFISCVFETGNYNSSSTYFSIVYSSSSTDSNFIFSNNYFRYGSYGFYWMGDNYEKSNVISNNVFTDQYYSAIYLNYQEKPVVENNVISANSNYYYYYGIYISSCNYGLRVTKNKIDIPNAQQGIGIILYYCYGTASQRVLVANNFIRVNSSANYDVYGIYAYNNQYLDVYYNSVNITGNYSNSYAFLLNTFSYNDTRIKNNNFINNAGGYAFYSSSVQTFSSDYNNLLTTGNYLGYYGANCSTLSSWISATSCDSHSISVNPEYFSVSDLHSFSKNINGKAIPVSSVTDDIDGEPRDSLYPDIGADEFTPPNVDAGIIALDEPSSPCQRGTRTFKVSIKNYATDTLKSVTVEWEVDGSAKTAYNWTGSLASGDTAVAVTIGSAYLSWGNHSIKVWTKNPNSKTDGNKNNDTFQTSLVAKNPLNGTYTIGNSPTDSFSSFSEAVDSLMSNGVSGHVIFNVKDGTYTEQITIGSVFGASAQRTITFQSASNDSTKVILQYNSTNYSYNYVVKLNGANYITFRKMTLKSLNTTLGRVIELSQNAGNNIFSNNYIERPLVNTSSEYSALVYVYYTNCDNNQFISNYLKNGSFGFYIMGNSSTSTMNGLVIRNNIFDNIFYYGIYLRYCSSFEISGNLINTSASAYNYGIYLYQCYSQGTIAGNKINLGIQGYGLICYYCEGKNDKPINIFNNFISISGNATARGIYCYYSYYLNFYYNNVNITNTGNSGGYCIGLTGGSNIQLKNNIFCNKGDGYAIYVSSNYALTYSDYNNLYATGQNLGYWGSSARSNLAAWRSASNFDYHSVSVDPQFYSNTNLHVREISLNSKANPVSFITTDIDNEPRNVSTPDIGADEFNPPANDAGLVALINPVKPFVAGTQAVVVRLRNFGSDTLKSVIINWKLNGVTQTAYNWTGSLKSADTVYVVLGVRTFNFSNTYNIVAWTSLPNGSTDNNTANDTISATDLTPGLSGVYTIGGTSPDFTTFTAAVNAMKSGGILGSVLFNVRNGNYLEQLDITEITGSSATNTIVFQSESLDSTKVRLQYSANSANNYTLRFNGIDYITFRYMTIKALNTTYGRVIEVINNSLYCSLKNNVIEGSNASSYSSNNYLIYNNSSNNNYLTISANLIKKGSCAIYLYGTSGYQQYVVIEKNRIDSIGDIGINAYYQSNLTIQNNLLNLNSTTSYIFGIELQSCYNKTIIKGNKILMPNGVGLYCYSVQGNSSDYNLVANNFISMGSGFSDAYGIELYYTSNTNFYYNSVNVYNTYSTSEGVYLYGGGNLNFVNNIFSCNGGYAYYINSPSAVNTSNYNDFYTTGTYLAYWNGNRTNLADLKSASGKDANSISKNPLFVSNTDLHVQEVALNKAATPISQVTEDIDGEPRDATHPDIGADEFTPPLQNDAGINDIVSPITPFPADTNMVKVVLTNYGADTLKSVTIKWKVNGVSQTDYNWTGSLLTGSSDTVLIGKFRFLTGTGYQIKAYSVNPNGQADSFTSNDTAWSSVLYAALNGTYTIGGSNPDFNSFTDAVSILNNGGVLGAVTFNVRNGIYFEKIKINQYPGSQSSRPVVFQSESGDSSQVFLSWNTDNDNYTLWLSGADYITFRKMTIRTTVSSGNYGRVVKISDDATYCTFSNNIIQGYNGNVTSTFFAVIYSEIGNNHHLTFSNNNIMYGSLGLYIIGNSSEFSAGNKISGNIILNPCNAGIYAYYQDGIVIEKNSISLSSFYNYSQGIYLIYGSNAFRISENKISVPYGYMGIYLYNCNGTSTSRGNIYNNFIYCGGSTSNPSALSINQSNYINIYYNNLNITTSNSGSRSLYLTSSAYLNIYNNNLISKGAGYAIYISNLSSSSSNYNNIYTKGSNLACNNGINLVDLTAWRSSTGWDANSLSVDPQYISNSDLHVREITLNEAGTPVPGITTDIDGDIRNTTKPDIGADEFAAPYADDAGILSFVYPVVPFPADTLPVKVLLKNYGYDTLTSVVIRWSVNGVSQIQKSWTGMILPGKTDTVVLGNYIFKTAIAYNMVAYTYNPNGVRDSLNLNDTAKVNNLYAALSGTYTIGGSNPDFISFGSATNILNNGGVVGAVIFNVRTGVYNEQIVLNQIPGSSATNNIVFQSEGDDSNLVTLTYQANSNENYVLRLKGADYVTFKKMTFQPLHNYYARAVELSNGSHDNKFLNCRFEGIPTTNTSDFFSLVYSGSDDDIGNEFKNNVFSNGSYGIRFYSASGSSESGTVISNNVFDNQSASAVFLYGQNEPIVSGNTVSSTVSSYLGGIALNTITNGPKIFSNKITADKGSFSLQLYDADGTSSNRVKIYNNFFQIGGTSSCVAVSLTLCDNVDFVFNSIHVSNTHPDSRALSVESGNSSLVLRNNIFANSGGGYACYVSYPSAVYSSDYNDHYTTGTVLGYWGGNRANLSAWKSASNQDNNSKSVDPLFFSTTDLHISQVLLDSAGIPFAGITKDIDNQNRSTNYPDIGADEFTYVSHDVGVYAVLNPVSGCGLSTDTVRIKIQNFGGQAQSNFNVAYKLDNQTPVVRNIGSITIPKGSSYIYKFDTVLNISSSGNHVLICWTMLSGDTIKSNDTFIYNFSNYSNPSAVSNMLPYDSAENIALPVTFSWSPASGATSYDLYLWLETDNKPVNPTVSNITQITHTYHGSLQYGKTYKWQIVAKSIFCQTAGNIQRFTVRNLPDLIVNSVTVPSTSYSGQTFNVSWQIKNIGTGSTLSTEWHDEVYLSSDTIFDEGVDYYLGGVTNLSSLNSGQSYNQTETFTIPQGLSGNYYVIILTDKFEKLIETKEDNNKGFNTTVMQVQLTPPPDLQVVSIIKPNTVYSGTNANVSWTVQNKGTGNTVTNYWYDAVYLGQDTTFNPSNCYQLGTVFHNGQLLVNGSYNAGRTVSIPNAIFGTYYIFVQTDVLNSEYEHAWENNNVKRSDPMSIVLTPPPDLYVTGMDVPDTASNNESINISYYLKNQGGNDPENSWHDRIYISASRIFNESTATLLATRYHSPDLSPGQTDTLNQTVTIPLVITGKYYIFVKTDYFNTVYEYTYENNNLSDPDSIIIKSPDLMVPWISNPSAAYSGTPIAMSWKDRNAGPGKIINRNWSDKLYISSSSTFNPASAVLLKEFNISTTSLNINDEKLNSTTVAIPNGYSGKYYLYVVTDAGNNIFEAGNEGNNVKKSDTSIQITLSPWPDLQVTELTAPDTATAGDVITLNFTVKNKGTANASTTPWKDKVFISTDSVFNTSKVSLLKEITRGQALAVSDSYNITTMAGLSSSLSAGIYYLHVYTDYDDNVYEHTSNNNNSRFYRIYIKSYPPVDFRIESVSHQDTGSSGKAFAITYTVKNIGQGKSLANSYKNAVFLSTDSIWSPATDLLVNREDMTTQLAANASYTKNISVTLPNGITGNYYLLVITDENNNNNDVNLSNNYRAKTDAQNKMKKIYIKQTLTPDLKPTVVNAPSTGTAGQPVTVSWTVKNQGQAATSEIFEDRLYLSSDFTIDGGDVLLGSYQRTTSLAVNSSYSQSLQVFLPSNVTGNRIILLKTDATDAEYEHNGEDNNVMGAPISITAAPPCDLIVSHIGLPFNAVAGKTTTISYKVKNTGVNPATGYIRDAVYISKDNQWDVNDVLFGVNQYYIGLSPNTETSKSLTKSLTGVTLGYYYVIVRTDILSNINETNDNNNEKVSTDTMKVSVQNLPWYTMTYDTLYDNSEVYFKLESHDTLKTETLLLNLYGDSINGDNELYLRYLKVPTRNVYDYAYSEPFHGNQEIIVPSLEDSTYYIMVYGYTMVGNMQKIGLMAKILHFEVRSIEAKTGGNTGKVTVIVSGSKFDTTMTVILKGDSATYEPDTMVYVNPTRVFVTYDLRGAKLGKYDVVAIKTSKPDTATLVKGFEIVAGVAPDLQVNISKPANVRPSAITAMSVDFANLGNTDIEVPEIVLKSLALAPVGMSVPDLENKKTELTFLLRELNGPQWVIRPGAYGSVLIYTKSTAGLGFQIMLPEIK